MTSPVDISPDHLEIVRDILVKHLPAGVKVWVFGSRANWTTKDSSDLDLALEGEGRLSHKALGALKDAFEDSSLPYTVDVVDFNRIGDAFKQIVELQRTPLPPISRSLVMAGEWRQLPFSQAVELNPRVQLRRGDIYPFVDMASVLPNARTVQPVENREFKGGGSRFLEGDTLMARITPCLENGKIARFRQSSTRLASPAHGSTEFIVIRSREGLSDTGFAYYLAKWDELRDYAISQMSGTSGRQRVPVDCFDHFIVSLPPLPEQRAIAHILGTLDDKIELNRRMNETLEAIARALFKSWFVDFDPVRAKMDGRDTGLPPHIAALFPDRLVPSELGEIPAGWGVGLVGDYFNLTMGQSPPGSTYNDTGVGLPFFQGRTDFGFRYPTNRKFCTEPKRLAQAEDTLVSVRAPVGDLNRAWEVSCIGRGVAALNHCSGSSSYTYYVAMELQHEIKKFEHTGTVFGSINKNQFANLQIIEPSEELVKALDENISPLDKRIRENVAESSTLADLRDALLPKLMSGDLRAQDAESFLESAL